MGLVRSLLGVALLHVLLGVGLFGYEVYNVMRPHLRFTAAAEDPNHTMKAAQFDKIGEADVVKEATIPRPLCCSDGEVLVQVEAGGLNPVDFKQRRLEAPAMIRPLPSVSGFDFSGVILQVGPNVTSLKPQDKVFGMLPLMGQRWGAFQEFVVVHSRIIAKAPSKVSLQDAAGLPLVGLTTVHSLQPVLQAWKDAGTSSKGKKILIHAGAGGVGSFAIQYCKNVLGMEVATTASASKAEFVRGLGADTVIDYKTTKFEDALKDFDVVLDLVTQEYEQRALKSPTLLKGNGRGHYVHVISTDWQPNSRETGLGMYSPLVKKWGYSLLARFFNLGVYYHCKPVEPDGAGLESIAGWVSKGQIKPVVDRVFKLSEVAEAHKYLETGRAKGKVIIQVRGNPEAKE